MMRNTSRPLWTGTVLQLLLLLLLPLTIVSYTIPTVPKISPATGLENKFYSWKENQRIRYQCNGPEDGEPIVLVHGLFVNSDHWRKSLAALPEQGYRVFALDLLGCGFSDKPASDSQIAQQVNGENTKGRFDSNNKPCVLRNVKLGSANGRDTRIRDVELRHPLGSPYNFYTWSELVTDFCRDVVLSDDKVHQDVTLVSNSIGTNTCLQAVLDTPDLYKGVFVITPNFRELHSAEVPFSLVMPLVRTLQALLRQYGQNVFDALAKPDTVREILNVPYCNKDAVDDTLVQVLLDPLLTDNASKVVFDLLSYSAGPLPEQQLSSFPKNKPVWICYGKDDPWTPGPRVEALQKIPCVELVKGFDQVGHCPHDEAPELVHPLLLQFLERLKKGGDCSQQQQKDDSSSLAVKQ